MIPTNCNRLQEEIFAKRAVVFVNDRIYFRCQRCMWQEDTTIDDMPLDLTATFGGLKHMAIDPRISIDFGFQTLITDYLQRQLSHQNDILNAASGLFRRLSIEKNTSFLEGQPTAFFDKWILFSGKDRGPTDFLIRRWGFASYSWAGWVNNIEWNFLGERELFYQGREWLAQRTWIKWYARDQYNSLSVIDWRMTQLVCKQESIYRSDFKSDYVQKLDTWRKLPTSYLSLTQPLRPYTLIHFWTVSAAFELACDDQSPRLDYRFDIIGLTGKPVGIIELDCALRESSARPCELLVMSECRYRGDLPGFRGEPPWNGYWVMLIEWDGPVAERRGIGQILKPALAEAFPPGPAWKEIILG